MHSELLTIRIVADELWLFVSPRLEVVALPICTQTPPLPKMREKKPTKKMDRSLAQCVRVPAGPCASDRSYYPAIELSAANMSDLLNLFAKLFIPSSGYIEGLISFS